MASPGSMLALVLFICAPISCHAHGRMLKPCSRNSGYICGQGTPVNYNDHEMNCGGRVVEWDQNGGKCGICGDPWPGQHLYERPNGSMVQHNVISETYLENQIISILLQITVAHRGWHEFRICNVATTGGVEATQECLDKILLKDENGESRFTKGTTEAGYFDFTLVLPEGLTCTQCVVQWKWKCGNDYGCFSNGYCCLGCGDRQEEFYACSDITVNPRDLRHNVTTQSTSLATSQSTTATTTTSTAKPTTVAPTTQAPTTTTTLTTLPSTTSILLSTLSSSPTSTTTEPTTTTTKRTTTTMPSTATTTQPTTTTTTTTTTTPTTTRAAVVIVPGNSFQQNRINQMSGLKNIPNNNSSIRYSGGSSPNAVYGIVSYKTQEDFINMIIGTRASISPRAGSVPDPNPSVRETEEKRISDRICAMCASRSCLVNICRSSCPAAPPCTTTP